MEFLNIGGWELVLILLIAIVVLGPKQTVQLAQQAGRFLARLRRDWNEVRRDVIREIQELDLSDVVDERPVLAPKELRPGDEAG